MSSTSARCIGTITAAVGLLAAVLTATPNATAATAAPGHGGIAPKASAAQLAAADAAVRRADVAGTAWHADPATGTLVVTADSRVRGDQIARIQHAVADAMADAAPAAHDAPGADAAPARAAADAVHVRRVPGRFAERIAGGEYITGPGGVRCTVGFNLTDGAGGKYALTAGHCTGIGGTWSIGPVVASVFPGSDYGIIKYTDPSLAEGGVRAPGGPLIDIANARMPQVGETVCRIGPTTGLHCGSVFAINATVNYGSDGIVTGLIQTNVCAEPGDSGGPLFAGNSALGITSGGSGNCSSGGTTFFQPVLEPLNAFGLMVF